MIPNLILNELYELNEDIVLNKIENSYLDGAICGRMQGFRISKLGDGYRIHAWQCNKADVQNNDVNLPTIIVLNLSEEARILNVQLHISFKGSQGITCPQRFLNERLQKVLTGIEFRLSNPCVKDEMMLYCRHLFELILGSCSFFEYCLKNNITEGYVSESIMSFDVDGLIQTIDRISINGLENITKIEIGDYVKNIEFGLNGEIRKINGAQITAFQFREDGWVQIVEKKIMSAQNREEVQMKLMKIISKSWIKCGVHMAIKNNFYFTILYPTSFFGIFTQSVALFVFNKNYSYFQHCINGLQRVNNIPQCIGTIQSVEEGKNLFEGFHEGYLY